MGSFTHDHELKIGDTTTRLYLIRDENGVAMYSITEEIPRYQDPLRFEQTDWRGGHGQNEFKAGDKYFEGQSIDTTQEGRVFLGPLINEQQEDNATDLDGPVVCFCWFPAITKLMCATATNIYRLDSDGWDLTTTAISGVTDLKIFNTILYAAVGTSTRYYYSTNGDDFTQTDLTDGYAEKFLVAPNPAGTADVLWKFKQPNQVSETTDGRTAAGGGVQWSTPPNYIGDTTNNIINLFLVNDNLMTGRTDGLWHLDSDGGIHPVMADLIHNRSTSNFKYVIPWQTGIYFSLIRGLGEITSYNTYAVMGPLAGIDDIAKIGTVVGIASDKDWLFVALSEGTNTHIYKGQKVRREGVLRWEWCPWVFLGTKTCASMMVVQHSATDRRLWFGYTNSTAYVILSDNPLADSAARFCASGFLRMSYTYGTDSYFDKLWQSAVLEMTRFNSGAETAASSGETIQVQYRDDTDTTATECIAAHNTAGVHEVNFTSALANKRIQFELHLASDTTTATPAVTYFQAKGIEKPTPIRIHEATYKIGDEPSVRAKSTRTFLRGGRTSTSLIKFADLRYGDKTTGTSTGDYVWVIFLPGSPREIEVGHTIGRQPELGIQVRMKEVSFTIS